MTDPAVKPPTHTVRRLAAQLRGEDLPPASHPDRAPTSAERLAATLRPPLADDEQDDADV